MSCKRAAWFVSVVIALLLPTVASSQIPAENHYKVYEEVANELPYFVPIVLRDQFGTVTVDVIQRDKFATPVSKDGSVIYDALAYQTWFRVFVAQPERDVLVNDQFGTNTWRLGNIGLLVAPADKILGTQGHPPVRNHYLCYEAILAPAVGKAVTLVDEFGQEQVFVVTGRALCNPVEKIVGGVTYPIIDPAAHLTVYTVENTSAFARYITVSDQFGATDMVLIRNQYLCLPASKGPVATKQSTWGRIKALYR